MKAKLSFVLLTLFVLAVSCNSSPKFILNPDVDSNNTGGALDISKIVLTDTATVVHFDVYQTPSPGSWFRISPNSTLTDNKGNVYKIIACSGITLGKEEHTPESGYVTFSISFESLNTGADILDFKEGDNNGDWQIMGIKLYPGKYQAKAIQCKLTGDVIDRPYSSRLIVSKLNEDARVAKVAYIPIRDGKFEYVLNCDNKEMYVLTFLDEYQQGSWRPVQFLSEQGTVHFTLYPADEYIKNQIEGGALNAEYESYEKRMNTVLNPLYDSLSRKADKLQQQGSYFSPEAAKLYEKLDNAKDEERTGLFKELEKLRANERDLTPEALSLKKEREDIVKIALDMRLQYAREKPTIVGYSIIVQSTWEAIHFSKTDIAPMVEIYNTVYAPKYPTHPYTEQMILLVNSASSIKVGGHFIDFEAPDFKGNTVKLSEQINGKIALIHLWASWCGPCRRHGKEMIPVYETYKDKGFTVVGVARENTGSEAMAAIEKDKYPWLNLLELNDKAQIWTQYGLGNAGGGDFLVDEKGAILAVGPTAEEVEKILKERLK